MGRKAAEDGQGSREWVGWLLRMERDRLLRMRRVAAEDGRGEVAMEWLLEGEYRVVADYG